MNRLKRQFDWHVTRWGGVVSVAIIKPWLLLTRKVSFSTDFSTPPNRNETIVIAANHQTSIDTMTIYSALSLQNLYKLSPSKFMVWHKYFNTKYKPLLWSMGSFASHGDGHTGVQGSVHFAKQGYRLFIFPEGRRIRGGKRTPAYYGICQIIKQLPESRLILVYLDWEKRQKTLSRPKLTVNIFEAPADLDRNDPDAIMDAIYDRAKVIH